MIRAVIKGVRKTVLNVTMARGVVLLALFAAALVAATQAATSTTVSVYYESLCPDSIRFITQQLTPTYHNLGSDNLVIDFLPYGKATTTIDANGNYQFTCQHGDEECRGNKNQACALKYITNPDTQVEFINCVMGSAYPPDAGQSCAASNGIADYSPIENCSNSVEGDELLAAYGERTHALVPTITFVPTIVYDGVFNQQDQDDSLTDFQGVVCRHLSPQPPECTAK